MGVYTPRYVHIGVASHARGHWLKSSTAQFSQEESRAASTLSILAFFELNRGEE